MKKFIADIRKYHHYIVYSAKSQLKAEVTDSYLSWLWLFIEPFCFMLIYAFLALVVFKSKMEYFPIFVFIGLTIWNFFQKTLVDSVRLVSSNRDIVTKVYVPKTVLLIIKMYVNSIKFFISFSLVIIGMIIYRVPISLNVLCFVPLFLCLFVITFGVSSIFMHVGVFVQDLSNITTISLRLLFYVSGVFFSLDKTIPYPYNNLLIRFNPIACCIYQCRRILIYNQSLDIIYIMIWFIVGVILSYVGIKTIYKYENTYVKVMK